MSNDQSVLARLMAVIDDRLSRRPAGSYTAQLAGGGVDRIGGKLCEEAGELVEAARAAYEGAGHQAVIHEAADLVFHTLVLLTYCGVRLADVEAELSRRFGISGLEEKASPPRGK